MIRRLLPLASALLCLPGGLPAAPPLAPPPREVAPPRLDPQEQAYRESLRKMEALRQRLEAQRAEDVKERARLQAIEADLMRMIAETGTRQPGPPRWMPMMTAEDYRALRGLPPLPRPPVRD